jgi:outer membrane protein assembly factor BamB
MARNAALLRLVACVLCGGLSLLCAAEANGGKPDAPLGSPDYRPSPVRPVGWRGDGSGRYPAATPPIEWGRTIKSFFIGLKSQVGKPKADAEAGELLNMGALRDWLILGPFDVKDGGAKEEYVKGEATILPQEGEKVGNKEWQRWRISVAKQSQSWGRLVLDLALAYGKEQKQEWQNHPGTLEPLCAYAQTSIYSPADGKARLRFEGTNGKMAWLNGVPVKMPGQYEASPVVEFKRGWNNLVVKALSSKQNWHFSACVLPPEPLAYETKNIVWMTPMPGPSWCSPIIVGDRIFVSADDATLVCLNKADGKVLWMRSTTYYHAIPDEEKQKFPDLEAKAKQLDAACEALPEVLNAAISPDGSKADHNPALQAKIKAKRDLENGIQQAMGKADRKKYETWGNDIDTSKYTPTSDGKYVYAAFSGGNKGLGANVVACFDLDGKRIWSYFTGQTGIGEHGTHSSPALCGEYLVFKSGEKLLGFEKATGKVAWQVPLNGTGLGASTVPLRIGNAFLAYVPQCGIYNPANGTEVWKAECTTGIPTPCVTDGGIFGVDTDKDTYFAFKLPAEAGPKLAVSRVAKTTWKTTGCQMPGTFTNSIIGSPLYHEGLVYVVSEGGGLTVVEADTGKLVYTKILDMLQPRLTWVFVVGICTGPTLAGKAIHIRDDQQQTIVIAPGREFKQLAKNQLMEFQGDGHPEAQSNAFFEGGRMYYRTRAFLYCIGEK